MFRDACGARCALSRCQALCFDCRTCRNRFIPVAGNEGGQFPQSASCSRALSLCVVVRKRLRNGFGTARGGDRARSFVCGHEYRLFGACAHGRGAHGACARPCLRSRRGRRLFVRCSRSGRNICYGGCGAQRFHALSCRDARKRPFFRGGSMCGHDFPCLRTLSALLCLRKVCGQKKERRQGSGAPCGVPAFPSRAGRRHTAALSVGGRVRSAVLSGLYF